jgi:hypothetical protein
LQIKKVNAIRRTKQKAFFEKQSHCFLLLAAPLSAYTPAGITPMACIRWNRV